MNSQRVALVTGGGRGIGRGIALGLAWHDWYAIVNYRGNAEAAAATIAVIEAAGGQAEAVQADVSQLAEHRTLIDGILARHGRLDLLVNNAGMAPRQRKDLLEMTEASFDEVMAVNLKGPLFLTQRVASVMIQLLNEAAIESARIINIGSLSAYTSSTNRGEYCISKAGMGMMTMLFADRLAEHGIPVYEVRPGIISTDMTSAVTSKYDELIAGGLTPIKRWGQPEDIAKAVVALAEAYFPFSTGEIINVDGGFHVRRL